MNASPEKEIRNAVEEAVYVALGGVREVAKRLDCATQSVYEHLGRGLIRNREVALEYERLTQEAGHAVPAAELMDLVPWQGPQRMGTPPKGSKRRGKDSAASATPPVTRLRPRAEAAAIASERRKFTRRLRETGSVAKFSALDPAGSYAVFSGSLAQPSASFKRTGTEG